MNCGRVRDARWSGRCPFDSARGVSASHASVSATRSGESAGSESRTAAICARVVSSSCPLALSESTRARTRWRLASTTSGLGAVLRDSRRSGVCPLPAVAVLVGAVAVGVLNVGGTFADMGGRSVGMGGASADTGADTGTVTGTVVGGARGGVSGTWTRGSVCLGSTDWGAGVASTFTAAGAVRLQVPVQRRDSATHHHPGGTCRARRATHREAGEQRPRR